MTSGLRERKKQATRQAISDIATGMFERDGFDAVSIAQVAAEANVAKMTVTNYFARKEDLVFDRADFLIGELSRTVAERPAGQTPLEAARAGVLAAGRGRRPLVSPPRGRPGRGSWPRWGRAPRWSASPASRSRAWWTAARSSPAATARCWTCGTGGWAHHRAARSRAAGGPLPRDAGPGGRAPGRPPAGRVRAGRPGRPVPRRAARVSRPHPDQRGPAA